MFSWNHSLGLEGTLKIIPFVFRIVYIFREKNFFPMMWFDCLNTLTHMGLIWLLIEKYIDDCFKPDNTSWFYFLLLLTIHCTLFTIIFFGSFLKLLCNSECAVLVLIPLAVAKRILVIFMIKGCEKHLTTMHLICFHSFG